MARLVLLGNCQIGLHEQTRLQPQIQEAMDAPIDVILKKHLHDSLGTGAGQGILQTLIGAVEKPLADLTDVAQDLWERIATRYLMSLALPGGAQLPLGRNIPKDAAAQGLPARGAPERDRARRPGDAHQAVRPRARRDRTWEAPRSTGGCSRTG